MAEDPEDLGIHVGQAGSCYHREVDREGAVHGQEVHGDQTVVDYSSFDHEAGRDPEAHGDQMVVGCSSFGREEEVLAQEGGEDRKVCDRPA